MKKIIFTIIFVSSSLLAFMQGSNNVIMQAMKDELNRNMEQLMLENLEKPFYIAYTMGDIELTYIGASLGSIINYKTDKLRTQNTNLLVGDYQRANNNYIDANVLYRRSPSVDVPIDDDYIGLRKVFWKTGDSEYKFAASQFQSKLSAINNQNIPEEDLNIADFLKADSVTIEISESDFSYNINEWKDIARDVSAVFLDFPKIMESHVSIYFYNIYINFYNSEGSKLSYPLTYAAVLITAETLAEDGQRIFDHIHHYSVEPDGLPKLQKLKKHAGFIAEKLTDMITAPVFDDYYIGPVLLEEQAVSEYFLSRVFNTPTSLVARRVPVFQNERIKSIIGERGERNRLELRHDRRIMDRSITIVSDPLISEYNNIKLVGHYPVDAEAVVPEKTVLVENGILRNFISNRVPNKVSNQSNGSRRIALRNRNISEQTAPGVIFVSSDNVMSDEDLKSELIRIAKYEDLDYALIVRKFEYSVSERTFESRSSVSSDIMSRPIYIYRVDLNDGSEQILRGAEISGLNIRSLNRIVACSKDQFVYNAMISQFSQYSNPGFFHGIPSSIINPAGILFREVEVRQASFSTQRPPAVKSPLAQ